MLLVLHGDNQVSSRHQLNQLLSEAKHKGVKDVIRLEGKILTQTDLIQALETTSLFGTDRLIIIESLFTRPKSKAKDQLTSYLKTIVTNTNIPQTILWENKTLTKTQLKSIGNPKDLCFPISKVLFKFLDALAPGKPQSNLKWFQQAKSQEPPELIFAMLIRQVRLLIQVKDRATSKLAPWQAQKLSRQASLFSPQKLLALHQQLLNLDHDNKTGHNLSPLGDTLDIVLATL